MCTFFISCISISDNKKNQLINLNPTLFHHEDNIEYIGKINLSLNYSIEVYFTEHLFGNNRASYRLVFFDNNNDSIICYKIEDKPYLKDNVLIFPYKQEHGNEIKMDNVIPETVFLNGEIINSIKIK